MSKILIDAVLIDEKLESLRRSILRVEEKYNYAKNTLLTDYDAQDVIALNLTRAVQLSVNIAMHIYRMLMYCHLLKWPSRLKNLLSLMLLMTLYRSV